MIQRKYLQAMIFRAKEGEFKMYPGTGWETP